MGHQQKVSNLDGRHESIGDDAHAEEHVDERNEVNDGPRHLIPYRRVLGVPHGQDHSYNVQKQLVLFQKAQDRQTQRWEVFPFAEVLKRVDALKWHSQQIIYVCSGGGRGNEIALQIYEYEQSTTREPAPRGVRRPLPGPPFSIDRVSLTFIIP